MSGEATVWEATDLGGSRRWEAPFAANKNGRPALSPFPRRHFSTVSLWLLALNTLRLVQE